MPIIKINSCGAFTPLQGLGVQEAWQAKAEADSCYLCKNKCCPQGERGGERKLSQQQIFN